MGDWSESLSFNLKVLDSNLNLPDERSNQHATSRGIDFYSVNLILTTSSTAYYDVSVCSIKIVVFR